MGDEMPVLGDQLLAKLHCFRLNDTFDSKFFEKR